MNDQANTGVAQQTFVVILAAGRGTRMGRSDLAKVCFEIDGVPAINRLIGTFTKNRFEKFMIVVGSMAEQVIQTVGREYPQALFLCQSPQLGTGHAGKVAAEALQNIGHAGPVLLCLGDKYLEPDAITALVEGFIRQQADLALLTVPWSRVTEASAGRVILDPTGQAVCIIERMDIARQAIVDELRERLGRRQKLTGKSIRDIALKHIKNPTKLARAVPELIELAGKDPFSRQQLEAVLDLPKYTLAVADRPLTARQVERTCKQFNPSLYLFSAEAFYRGVSMIDNNNAQQEYYLPDVVRHLSGVTTHDGQPRFRVRAVPVDDPTLIQGFNSPEELLTIQDHVRRRKLDLTARAAALKPRLPSRQYATVRQWLSRLEAAGPSLKRWLGRVYSQHPNLHAEKCGELHKVLTCFGRQFGFDEKVVIVRAPGRINLMGRHVDHRGGYNNFLALHRETIAVVGLRGDGNVRAVNTQSRKFESREFNIPELMGRFAWSDWVNFVNSQWVRDLLYSSQGDWSNYIKAAVLRLQHKYNDLKIHGMNLALHGSVPMAAGLSSSSTIVVATLQSAIALNNLELNSQQFIDLCGEGEWFVGSRGGAGDHAAIFLGQRSKIAQVGYHPFRVERIIDAPADYQVLIANSHVKAAKSSAARHQFNARVAGYNLGLALLRQRAPEAAHLLEHVRDINHERLACSTSDIYRLLLRVPQRMTRKDFEKTLPSDCRDLMETNFSSHQDPGQYDVRGVLMYGAAECQRSKICIDDLAAGRIDRFGQFMIISHDGDRVARPKGNGDYGPGQVDYTDEKMHGLIDDLTSEDPDRVLRAQLYMQPGTYACSTEEIDRMVDIACAVPGVAGAQIAGAGLGGCIMILARKDSAEAVERALVRAYYRPRKLPPAVIKCITVEGSGLASF
ncbi:MAG TPA: NTP transferase domain-containing protein [Phycisphaerae bacterium]|nr:NTP transferase domain-containing protein [Phycisphaerae bacterium]